MARPLQGTITQTARGWQVNVPVERGAKARRKHTFETREQALKWRDAAIRSLRDGRPLPAPEQYSASAGRRQASESASRRFADVAWACWAEEYRDNPVCTATNRDRTEQLIRLWLVPYFDRVVDDVRELDRDHVKQFTRIVAGREPLDALDPASSSVGGAGTVIEPRLLVRAGDVLTISDAARLTGLHRSTILRAVTSGRLPATRITSGSDTGQIRIIARDLLTAPLTMRNHTSERRPGRVKAGLGSGAAAKNHARDMLRTLRVILRWARGKRLMDHDPTEGVSALPPAPSKAFKPQTTTKPRSFTFSESARVAEHLHIHHQAAFWLQRILGLRVAEVFGLHVDDLVDDGTRGILSIQRQGGRVFIERDPDTGEDLRLPEKQQTKTASGDRLVVVPEQLMSYLRTYVRAFHQDPDTGEMNPHARLIVGTRKPGEGGIAGYSEQLKRAFAATGLSYEQLGFSAGTHHLRKSISTDLAVLTQMREAVRSQFLGHQLRAHDGGSAVTAASYTLKSPALAPLVDAARQIEELISDELSSLTIAGPKPAMYVEGHYLREPRWALHVDEVLSEAGLQTAGADAITIDEAARLLGANRDTITKLIDDGTLTALASPELRSSRPRTLVALSSVTAYQQRRQEMLTAIELAELAGVAPMVVYRRIYKGEISASKHGKTYTIERTEAERVIAELRDVAALHARSMTVNDAAKELGVSRDAVSALRSRGLLEADPDTSGQGSERWVLRSSVEAFKAAQRGVRRRPVRDIDLAGFAPIEDVIEQLGMNRIEVLALAKRGLVLRRIQGAFYVELASIPTELQP